MIQKKIKFDEYDLGDGKGIYQVSLVSLEQGSIRIELLEEMTNKDAAIDLVFRLSKGESLEVEHSIVKFQARS